MNLKQVRCGITPTDGKLRGLGVLEAWSSASNLINGKKWFWISWNSNCWLLLLWTKSNYHRIGNIINCQKNIMDQVGHLEELYQYCKKSRWSRNSNCSFNSFGMQVDITSRYRRSHSNAKLTEVYDGSSWTEQTGDIRHQGQNMAGFGSQTAALYLVVIHISTWN